MKALILTRCYISDKEKELINQSKIFKLALNNASYQADVRFFYDYKYWYHFMTAYSETLVTRALASLEIPKEQHDRFIFFNDALKPNTHNKEELYFDGVTGSLIPAMDLLIKLGVTEMLIVGSNQVDNVHFDKQLFESGINRSIEKFKPYANIYQFSTGNFNLPVCFIEDFLKKGIKDVKSSKKQSNTTGRLYKNN